MRALSEMKLYLEDESSQLTLEDKQRPNKWFYSKKMI